MRASTVSDKGHGAFRVVNDELVACCMDGLGVAFLAALNAYIRLRDHAQNVAETVTPEK